MLRPLCDDASNSVLIENNEVTQKWVATPFWSDFIVFNENNILSIITNCRSVDAGLKFEYLLYYVLYYER